MNGSIYCKFPIKYNSVFAKLQRTIRQTKYWNIREHLNSVWFFDSFFIVIFCFQLQAIALFAVIAVAYAQSPDATAETLRNEAVVNPDSFNYAYETSNGINAKSEGQLKQIGGEQGITAQGSYGYTSPEGEKIELSYVADENGKFKLFSFSSWLRGKCFHNLSNWICVTN